MKTIGHTTSNGLFQIVDTAGSEQGFRVTVREMVGNNCLAMSRAKMIQAMRRLARQAAPGKVLGSHVVAEFKGMGNTDNVTFLLKLLNPQNGLN